MTRVLFARDQGLMACPICSQVCRLPQQEKATLRCPRCHAVLHRCGERRQSLTWAYLVGAALLYIPANLLPVMHTSSIFGAQDDTILSGVVYLWTSGSVELAALVFIASVMVPLLKLVALGYLTASVRWGMLRGKMFRQRMRLYHIVEVVGRWSMLDIFVVALMVALVRFQSLAVIEARTGAAAFGGVVVLTMLAAMNFDPRAIWMGNDEGAGDNDDE